MWNLNLPKIESLLNGKIPLGSLAIETGTCRGNGARALAKKFSRVITIELDQALHHEAKKRLRAEQFTNIECLLGNSASKLEQALSKVSFAEPIFFFLDAHWSGDSSVDWDKSSWKGYGLDTAHLGAKKVMPSSEEQCPLLEELGVIHRFCAAPAIILIDDMKNLPSKGMGLKNATFSGEDWSHLSRERLFSTVRTRLEFQFELKDPEQLLLVLRPI